MHIILIDMIGSTHNPDINTNVKIIIAIRGNNTMANTIVLITKIVDTINILDGDISDDINTQKLVIIMDVIIVTTIIQGLFMRHLLKLYLALTQQMHGLCYAIKYLALRSRNL